MIDILIPNYHRPQNVKVLHESLLNNTSGEYRLVLIQERGDKLGQEEACKYGHTPIIGNFSSYANAINTGYFLTDSEFIFLGVDDIEFSKNWDVQPIRMLSERLDKHVICHHTIGKDCGPDGVYSCHFTVRRSYVLENSLVSLMPNLLMYPYYHHELDRELYWTAKVREVQLPCEDSIIIHDQKYDEVQKKTVSKDDIDRDTYNNRRHLFRGA